MSTHDGAVDHRVFVVGFLGEDFEDSLPDAGHRPSAEPLVHVDGITETFRQVAPGDTGPITVQHRLDKQAVIRRRHPNRARPAGQTVLDAIPLIVT